MRKLAALLLLLVSCGDDAADLYPKRAGEPCKLGSPPACADEGFMMACEERASWPSAEERKVFESMGYLGVWALNRDASCRP